LKENSTYKKIDIFKDYLKVNNPYKGGKTLAEIKSQTQKLYKLSSNENPIGASPKAEQAIVAAAQNLHLYPDRTDARLRTALARYYNDELKENQFVVANSGSETLELIIRAFMSEGHECIISNPTFLIYQMISKWQGAKINDVPLLEPDFKVDVEGILAMVNDNTRLLFLTSPNNPTGSYIPKQDIDTLISRLPEHVILVLDEVYYHFADADDYTTALSYVKAGKQVIGINSFSKTYGLAAMRIGYFYTTEKIADYIHQICKPFILNKLSIEAGIAALSDTDFVKDTVDLVQKERTFMQTELAKIGVHFWPSQGNFILTKPPMEEKVFEAKMLDLGVMVRPVSAFGAPGCVRITIGTREANEACLEALRKIYQNI
jgi:histidinol-phosphate aminotransferase